MQQLIPYTQRTIADETLPTVDARDLHAFLEIGKDYSNWIKAQIRRADLIENRDFIVFTQKGENPLGGRPEKEYHLTFDAAKHVSMMSRTPRRGEATS